VKNVDREESGWLTDPTEAAIQELESTEPSAGAVEDFSNAVAHAELPVEYHEKVYGLMLDESYEDARELAAEMEEKDRKALEDEEKFDQEEIRGLQWEFLYESVYQEKLNEDSEYGGRA
jgi:hypothetical protein